MWEMRGETWYSGLQTTYSSGRPVIQKLHSAAVTERADEAWLITTRNVTSEAREYANDKLGGYVRILEMEDIVDLAQRAGVTIAKHSEKHQSYCFESRQPAVLLAEFRHELLARATCEPPLGLADQHEHIDVALEPAWLVTYSLDDTAETTVGAIHRWSVNGQLLLHSDGQAFEPPTLRRRLLVTPRLPLQEEYPDSRPGQARSRRPDRNRVVSDICKQHTVEKSYKGLNNQRYTKVCQPRQSAVKLHEMRLVYIRRHLPCVTLLGKRYEGLVVDTTQGTVSLDDSALRCTVCTRVTRGRSQICALCGGRTHRPSLLYWWFGHAFRCSMCRRTICRACTRNTLTWWLGLRRLCRPCFVDVRQFIAWRGGDTWKAPPR